jgi:hypothetical protein
MGKATELSRRRFVGSALSAAALAALPARSMADYKMQKRGNEMTTLTPYLLFRWQMPAGHGILQILFWRRTGRDEG